jgi:ATP-GRASP peptide maturase of grasp-with-spasm system
MILIITEEADYSSSLVINWLLFYKIAFVRINENDIIQLEFLIDDIRFINDEINFKLSEIKGVWYRRGFLNVKNDLTNDSEINFFRKIESKKIIEYVYFKLSQLPHINKFENADVNKIIVCEYAKKSGLIVPEEYLLNLKNDLNMLTSINDYATKSIAGSSILHYGSHYIMAYTSLVKDIKQVPETFFTSLVQKYIEKKYELRIFYLNKKFYSMAIFSQNDKTTKIDFRNYNRTNPNRNVVFELPNSIKIKLVNLMDKLDLNSGSIDMIVTPNNDFVFLEVNPIGQYGMVSNPCNYYLHKKIAEFFKQI